MDKFINLDIGILMSSQSNDIWEEHLELYPGAKELSDAINSYGCHCPDPRSCRRNAFQLVLGQASQGDKEVAAKFIEEAQGLTDHEQVRDLMVRYYDETRPKEDPFYGKEGRNYITLDGEEAVDFLRRYFGGGTIQ